MSEFDRIIREETLYVLVADGRLKGKSMKEQPFVFDRHLDKGLSSLESIRRFQSEIGNFYGRTKIAKLVFID